MKERGIFGGAIEEIVQPQNAIINTVQDEPTS